MIDTYYKLSFILLMGMSAAVIVGLIPLLLIQSFIYKKVFDPTYLNTNHFSLYEVSIFDSLPLSLIKTLAYIRAIIFPKTMLKRFKTRILNPKDKPIVYFLALLTILLIVFCSLVLINTGIVGVFIYFEK